MKRVYLFGLGLMSLLVINAELAVAKKKPAPHLPATSCPKIIANEDAGEYQIIGKRFKCLSSLKIPAALRYKASTVCNAGATGTVTGISVTGAGSGVRESDPFHVINKPVAVDYSFDGSGSFRIVIVNADTGYVSNGSFVSTSGPITGTTTYINKPGRYYLQISGSVDHTGAGDWSVDIKAE